MKGMDSTIKALNVILRLSCLMFAPISPTITAQCEPACPESSRNEAYLLSGQ